MISETELAFGRQLMTEPTLVVDDDPDGLDMIYTIAEPFRKHLISACDSETAIRIMDEQKVGEVFCDGLEGSWFDVYKKAMEKEVTRFTLFSANDNAHRHARELGLEVIEKPAELDVLIKYFSA